MGSLYKQIEKEQAEYLKELEKQIQQQLEEEKWENCKCNNCVWAYKEAKYCPLGRCIQGNK